MLTELQKGTFDEMNLGVGKEVYVIVKLRRLRYVEP
jgi:molybdopterin-binding protein